MNITPAGRQNIANWILNGRANHFCSRPNMESSWDRGLHDHMLDDLEDTVQAGVRKDDAECSCNDNGGIQSGSGDNLIGDQTGSSLAEVRQQRKHRDANHWKKLEIGIIKINYDAAWYSSTRQ